MVKKATFPDFDNQGSNTKKRKGSKIDLKVADSEKTDSIEKEQVQPAAPEEKGSRETALQDELQRVKSERDEYLSHLQRLQAEFENYRKRIQKEKVELRDFLIQDFITSLLDIIDNMDRALHPDHNNCEVESYRQGVDMIFQQFMNILKERGLNRIETVGLAFDPHLHEAVGQVETDEYEPGIIVSEFMPGYRLNERVLRAPKVQVAAALRADDNSVELETEEQE